ncbi:MAG: phosphotransferase [Desulfobulbaceae bacterium]|nr:phosphotransferase [Desulfobulbaceae bacterium]
MTDELFGLSAIQRQAILALLAGQGVATLEQTDALRGDGSDRRFLRLHTQGRSLIAVLPSLTQSWALAEARAVWQIGRHLWSRQVPVPELFGFDPGTGIVLCEDLGDRQFQSLVRGGAAGSDEVLGLGRQAVELLLNMQLAGAVDFDAHWCWDTPSYDRDLMLARESGYFWQAFCQNLLGLVEKPRGLDDDFQRLADLAVAQPGGFFLHRDFQSRNLLSTAGRLRVLDFQGGRLGPLAYDLASFLNDPYIDLPLATRAELFGYYLELLAERRPELVEGVREGYIWLALQRNLQILGAFAFLSKVKGKRFFQGYLYPAAVQLRRLLNEPAGQRLPVLRDLVGELPVRLQDLNLT